MDRIDRAMLAALANDGRLSNKELAAKVGLAPSSCHERLRKLERSGAIRGYYADIDPSALGYGIEAMIAVRLRQHSRETYERFRAFLLELPEVVGVFHMSGEDDFLVHVVAKTPHHLREIATDHLMAREEVGHIETGLVFEHARARATY